MAQRYAVIAGTGHYLPAEVLDNDSFACREYQDDKGAVLRTDDAWIREHTGIVTRRKAASGETTVEMAIKASHDALARAEMTPKDLDRIIMATITPPKKIPSAACYLKKALDAQGAPVDVNAACSGFMYGLQIANDAIQAGSARNVLVVGSEKLTGITNYKDRSTCILFGDGAGAFVLRASDERRGVVKIVCGADVDDVGIVTCEHGGTMMMHGSKTYKKAVRNLYNAAKCVLDGMVLDRPVKILIPHQANMRIVEGLLGRLRSEPLPFTEGMVPYTNIERVGNTSAASIPIAMDECVAADSIKRGDNILLVSFGAGGTWAGGLLKW